jgi:hypothetical protein
MECTHRHGLVSHEKNRDVLRVEPKVDTPFPEHPKLSVLRLVCLRVATGGWPACGELDLQCATIGEKLRGPCIRLDLLGLAEITREGDVSPDCQSLALAWGFLSRDMLALSRACASAAEGFNHRARGLRWESNAMYQYGN